MNWKRIRGLSSRVVVSGCSFAEKRERVREKNG